MGQKKPINMSAMLKEARRSEDLAVAKALIVREAAIAAAQTFRHYAQIHRDKGDEAKAARNEDEAVKLTLAIMATANLPDFRALSNQLATDLGTARAEAAALRRDVERLTEDLRVARSDAATSGLIADAARRGTAEAMALVINHEGAIDRLTEERDALREEVEAMRAVVEAAQEVDMTTLRQIQDDESIATGEPWFASPVSVLRDALDVLRARKVGG